MADTRIHNLQAKHNYSFLKSFRKNQIFRDWQITVAFYTAMHIIECELNKLNPDWREARAQLSNKGMHAWRETCVQRTFNDIYSSYKLLYERSKTARYLEGTIGTKIAPEVLKEEDVAELIDKHLKKILVKFSFN